ncbi:GGDEF domain-containing protein [Marinobacter salinisoli]|uniref:diguanylate cyclase n=1 Tax=Marinobacter salinisoli TaxID=2769486 RepID=A0ABX7MMQ0_9GAMM|nr:diguanylate cyclase [Marinobacter salinisoli]QSP93502.1 GGDEF domain-containing protein [Marinobacter salinisoli]
MAPWLHAEDAVIEQPDFGSLELGIHGEFLEDPSGTLKIESLHRASQPWEPLGSAHLNARFSSGSLWLRASLINQSDDRLSTVLDSGSALADYMDIHVVRNDETTETVLSGDRRPFHDRPINTRTVTLPLDLKPGERVTVYMRQSNYDGLHETLTPTLWAAETYDAELQKDGLVFGFLYGTLGALLLYNLFLAFSTRQRGFVRYALLVACILGWSFIFRGYAFQYLWPDAPDLNNQMLAIFALAGHAAFGLFAIEYMNIRRLAPRWMYLANCIPVLLNTLLILFPLLGFYAVSFASWFLVGALTQITVAATGIRLIKRGSRPAAYFMLAFGALGAGIAIYYLHLAGWLEANLLTQYGIQVGASLQVLLLSLGLADQMNTLRADKLKAEQAARAAQLALNSKLTEEVKRRTLELEELNQKLRELSITDELTGCFNRRHFNQVFEEELTHHLRQALPLAFCIIDIDNFKAYNDALGHPAGDQVLQRVVRCLQENLKRRQDRLFRLGGEEFGVLLHMDQPVEKAVPFIEQLRRAIADLGLPHPGNPDGVVTASFGLVLRRPGSAITTSEDIYARADSLLYHAKSEGRNRVVYAIE